MTPTARSDPRTDENPYGWTGEEIDDLRCSIQRANQCPVDLDEDEIAVRWEDDAVACEQCCDVLGIRN